MIIPDHALKIILDQAEEERSRHKKRWDHPVRVSITLEHDWPPEAVVQLINLVHEHFIELDITFAHGSPGTSQPAP